MKPVPPLVALFVAALSAHGATAYKALEILGKQKGNTVINNVTEVRGDDGRPQPPAWRITVKDAQSRSGLREYTVQGTKLTGDQAPAARPVGPAIDMDELNLDSDGAQTIAEREAKKAAFAYDNASYSLRAGSRGGSPVWEIRLSDERSGDVATLTVAATTGNVLSTDGLTKRRKVATTEPSGVIEPTRKPAPAPDHVAAGTKSSGTNVAQSVGDELNYLGNRVGSHLARRGRQIGDFFYNLTHKDKRDTAGPHGSTPARESSPAPAQRPADGDTDYVRPSRVRD